MEAICAALKIIHFGSLYCPDTCTPPLSQCCKCWPRGGVRNFQKRIRRIMTNNHLYVFCFLLGINFWFFFLSYIFMPTTFSITYVRTVRTVSYAPSKDYVNEFLQRKNIIWDQVILLTPQKDSRFLLKTMLLLWLKQANSQPAIDRCLIEGKLSTDVLVRHPSTPTPQS